MGYVQNWETMLPELLASLKNVAISLNIGSFSVTAAAYILMALGLYAIAKKRDLKNPWLAWIPVADLWLLGCISDQYRYVTKGQERNRRKVMLGLAIAELATTPVVTVLLGVGVIGLIATVFSGSLAATGTGIIAMLVVLVLCLLLFLGLAVVSVVLQVHRCCALYDLFCSCESKHKTLYSVLSIVASCLGIHLVPAILVFICREKEEGMPPRIVDQVQ